MMSLPPTLWPLPFNSTGAASPPAAGIPGPAVTVFQRLFFSTSTGHTRPSALVPLPLPDRKHDLRPQLSSIAYQLQ